MAPRRRPGTSRLLVRSGRDDATVVEARSTSRYLVRSNPVAAALPNPAVVVTAAQLRRGHVVLEGGCALVVADARPVKRGIYRVAFVARGRARVAFDVPARRRFVLVAVARAAAARGRRRARANPTDRTVGARFDRCVAAVRARGGAYDSEAVCAATMRGTYGAQFQHIAAAGRSRAAAARRRRRA